MKVDLRSLVDKVEPSDSDLADIAALQLALDLTLAGDPPDQGRVEQVTDFINGNGNPQQPPRSPWEVARFCSYYQQMMRLELAPWMSPPCHIHTRQNAEAILKKGIRPGCDSGNDISDCGSARLTLDMIDVGVSRWHPDPVRAIGEARQAKRKR
jgi:hypothetical protein